MAPGEGVVVFGRDHVSHYSEYALSFTLSIHRTLIAIVLRDCNVVSYAIVNFYFILCWSCMIRGIHCFVAFPSFIPAHANHSLADILFEKTKV